VKEGGGGQNVKLSRRGLGELFDLFDVWLNKRWIRIVI
jgi:hypothetical protein